jgi:hypothetical protein
MSLRAPKERRFLRLSLRVPLGGDKSHTRMGLPRRCAPRNEFVGLPRFARNDKWNKIEKSGSV